MGEGGSGHQSPGQGCTGDDAGRKENQKGCTKLEDPDQMATKRFHVELGEYLDAGFIAPHLLKTRPADEKGNEDPKNEVADTFAFHWIEVSGVEVRKGVRLLSPGI